MILQKVKSRMYCKPIPNSGQELILAGAESKKFRKLLLECGVKSVLLSYFYLRKMLREGAETIENLRADLMNFDFVYIDSGGFTLQEALRAKKLDTELESYIDDFYDFCETMEGYVTVFGMVDVVETKQNFTMDRMYERAFEAKERGIHLAPTVFPAWGHDLPFQYKLHEEFLYLGMSFQKKYNSLASGLITRLSRTNLLHGYAKTAPEEFRLFPFRSVDSLTWLGGQKYGSTYVFRGNTIRTYNLDRKKVIRKTLWNLCKENNIDYDRVLGEDDEYRKYKTVSAETYYQVNKLNLVAWVQYADFLRKRDFRCYWLKHPKAVLVDSLTMEIISMPEDLEELLELTNGVDLPEEGNMDLPEVSDEETELVTPEPNEKPETSLDSTNNLPLNKFKGFGMKCDFCFISDKCPSFKEKSDCTIDFSESSTSVESISMKLIEKQNFRVNRGVLMESFNGGILDPALSAEITRAQNLLLNHKKLTASPESSLKIIATGKASEEVTKKGGLLSGLFQSMKESQEVDITPTNEEK